MGQVFLISSSRCYSLVTGAMLAGRSSKPRPIGLCCVMYIHDHQTKRSIAGRHVVYKPGVLWFSNIRWSRAVDRNANSTILVFQHYLLSAGMLARMYEYFAIADGRKLFPFSLFSTMIIRLYQCLLRNRHFAVCLQDNFPLTSPARRLAAVVKTYGLPFNAITAEMSSLRVHLGEGERERDLAAIQSALDCHIGDSLVLPTGTLAVIPVIAGLFPRSEQVAKQCSLSVQQHRLLLMNVMNRWGEVVTHAPCAGSVDGPGRLFINASIEDIVEVGNSNTLAIAGATFLRGCNENIATDGVMILDSKDIEDMETGGTLASTVLHEMGHVIGVGYVLYLKYGRALSVTGWRYRLS